MYQRTAWMMSKRSKWRPVKSAGVSEGSCIMPLIINTTHRLHQSHLKLDAARRRTLHSDGDEAYLFHPMVNYRTLVFDKSLSPRMIQKIIGRWGQFTGVGKITPHDLRRTVVTKLLNDGHTYREVQMVTKHKDPKTIQRYDHARENLDLSPVNSLSWDE